LKNTALINCNGKLYTDATGKVLCGEDQVNDADPDPNNELQTLYHSGNQICISDTGSCVIDNVNDGDTSSTNELQTLSEVLQKGNDAGTYGITGLNYLEFDGNIKLEPATVGSVSGLKLSGNAKGIATPNIKAAIYESGGKGYLYVDDISLYKGYISGYGNALYVDGVSALKVGNAYIGNYGGTGAVAVGKICLNGDCINSWSEVTGLGYGSAYSCTGYKNPGTKTCSISLSYPQYFCFLGGVNTGGCDGGAACYLSVSTSGWRIKVVSGGDCDSSPSCVAFCFRAN